MDEEKFKSPIMISEKPSAVVLGATGAVGGNVVRELLRSSVFGRITTLTRRPLDLPEAIPERVTQCITDVFDPTAYESFLAGNTVAFCTLGLGEPSKFSRKEFYRVDFQAVADFAAACRRQGIKHFALLTAVGANANLRLPFQFPYLRVKGEIEDRIRSLGFDRASFFRPSLLVTPENRYGLTQGILLKAFPRVDWIFAGPLSRYRSIRVEDLGRAMVRNAERPGSGFEILEWNQFRKLLRG